MPYYAPARAPPSAPVLSNASLRFPLRVLATLLLALAAAGVCLALHTPLPWMIGPLLAVSIASIAGAPTASHTPLRNAGQWAIGTALGLYFTPQVVALVASVWWAIALAIAWALAMGGAFSYGLYRLHAARMSHVPARSMRATAYFSGAIGGASEMTLLAERAGARTDLVASAHSLRVVMVTVLIPFAMQWSGMHGLEVNLSGAREVRPGGLFLLMLASGVGALLMRATGRSNPWFMGALLVAMGFSVAGVQLSAVPTWLSNTAQLVIAVSLGARFSREFLQTAPRWLGTVALGTLGLIALCGAFAWGLAMVTGLHPATMILGTSPGGIAEMSITAKVLQLGVPVVTAFQVCRLVAVLIIVGPLYGWLFGRK
ncbi:AbrB family transcriptional regulator [Variovorax ureilyticus]|uniref:AbrB family transcriptional regulator n=1 Tax=Variovorax ureilyticus TaxID=1836198 RepID=UPI003D671EFF